MCIPPTIRRYSTSSSRHYHRMYAFGRSCRVSADPTQGPHTCGWNRCSDTQTFCGEIYRGSYTRAYRGDTVATEKQSGPCCAAYCAAAAKRDNRQSCLWKNWSRGSAPTPSTPRQATSVADERLYSVRANRPFAIRVANFSASERTLAKTQVLGFANPAPDTVFEVDLPEDDSSRQPAKRVCADEIGLSHSEESRILGTGGDAKRGASFRDAIPELPMQSGVISRVKEPELPPSVDDLDLLHVDKKLRKHFRKLLSAFATMWDGNLGAIKYVLRSARQLLP